MAATLRLILAGVVVVLLKMHKLLLAATELLELLFFHTQAHNNLVGAQLLLQALVILFIHLLVLEL
jgi:hypothetical protein